jgi:DNA-binding MarR family transcriptional regulator
MILGWNDVRMTGAGRRATEPPGGGPPQVSGVAFLLSQVGARVSERFAERVGELGLTPAQVNLLRHLARHPGVSQQALAGLLGVAPSRVVALVDDLERRGLVERHRNPDDRRHHALQLGGGAAEQLARVRAVVQDHDAEVTAGLTAPERRRLAALLAKVADAQGLTPGVHPGLQTTVSAPSGGPRRRGRSRARPGAG